MSTIEADGNVPAPAPLLEARDVSRVFRVGPPFGRKQLTAVDRVSLRIEDGETVGLVGESGCGKSTLARMILRLDTPTSGSLFFRGQRYDQMGRDARRAFRREVQAVFQDPYSSLDPSQRIGSVVGEPLRHCSRGERRQRVQEALGAVGLDQEEILRRYPHQFSGGQRQRIALARALAPRPRLIILDEPTSSLDVSMRAQVLNLLLRLQRTRESSFLLISHDILSVRHLADRCVVMYLGLTMELGPSAEVIDRPLHPYTKALVDAMANPTPVRSLAGTAAASRDEVPSPLNRPPGCPFSTRCPQVMERCRGHEPPLLAVAAGRSVACWLYDGATAAAASPEPIARDWQAASTQEG